ncbi:hypothetical protein RPALISO_138 [Ruegeria phage RpAliso]|nr:hypothetical protein RPALISO_138 [Ruegeria phage RpAliso]
MRYQFPDEPVHPTHSLMFDDSGMYPEDPPTFLEKVRDVLAPVLHWALRPVRAMILAYRHVLSGIPVETPYNWKEI